MELEQPLPDSAAMEAIARRIDRPIVLVGMMGVGKTSLGRKLAAQLGVPFVDADEEIEKAAQMTIPEIFASYGEPFFRSGEKRVIARLLGLGDHPAEPPSPSEIKVIATGGGAFCHPETRALILERAIAVWLDADLDTLVERTARKDNRPLLRGSDRRETLARLRAEREPAYAQAPIHILSGNAPHARTLARLMLGIGQWLDSDTQPAQTGPA